MQETKTNALGIRVTDTELRRLAAIKDKLGFPSMPTTTLGHDLLVLGMDQMESRPDAVSKDTGSSKSKKKPSAKKAGQNGRAAQRPGQSRVNAVPATSRSGTEDVRCEQ